VRIVTWNLNHGHGSAAWPRLQAHLGAEVVLLQETRRPEWAGGLLWGSVPHHDRGSAVLATKGTFRAVPVRGYEGWVVGGELLDSGMNADGRRLFAFSVHTPTSHATRARQPYVAEVMNILDLLSRKVPRDADLILGGDFNLRSLGERSDEETFKTSEVERKCLTRFSGMGLVSCWAAAHPGRPLPQTLRWTGDKTPDKSTPYHCDGIFVPESWKEGMICEVFTSVCFEVSDHNPVVAWISR
jgi:hypothetical protein